MSWLQTITFSITGAISAFGTSLGTVLNNITADIRTWGGNVDAGGNKLVNCGGILDTSGNPIAGIETTAYKFAAISPGGSLIVGSNTITLANVPLGVNGTDASHPLYISGGTGAAETVLITGGTAVAGGSGQTLTFTCLNAHTGAWTIQSATAGIREAIIAAPAGSTVAMPVGTLSVDALVLDKAVDLVGAGPYATTLVPLTGAMGTFLLNIAPSAPIYGIDIGNFGINLSGFGSLSQIGFSNVSVAKIHDMLGQFGTNGFDLYGVVTFCDFARILILDSTGAGWLENGELVQNVTYENIEIQLDNSGTNMAAGFKHTRTTSTYLGQIKPTGISVNQVTTGGSHALSVGFLFTSTVAVDVDVFMDGCIADGISGDAVQLTNMGGFMAQGSWFAATGSGTGNAVTIDGGSGIFQFTGCRMLAPNGSIFNFLHTLAVAANIAVHDNFFEDCPNYIFKLPGGGANYPVNLQWSNNQDNGIAVTNDPSGLLFSTAGTPNSAAPFQVWTWPFGAGGYNLDIYDPVNVAHGYVRNNNGVITFAPPLIAPGYNLATSSAGTNNHPSCNLGATVGLTPVTGVEMLLKLAVSLQAGANDIAVGGLSAVAIKSSRNPANNIATAYVSGAWIRLAYDSTGPAWLDLSQ